MSYSPKEKFIRRLYQTPGVNTDEVWVKETLPRMGFEMIGIEYASERKVNTMDRLHSSQTTQFMYNRVPYNFNLALYVGTRLFDDSLRIVEQIIPYFTPEFTVKVLDKEDFNIATNVPFVLDSIDLEMDSDASMEDERRSIMWTLQFTAKGYMYPATTKSTLIKKSTIDISNQDTQSFYEQYMAYVDPMTAEKGDPHQIVEEINDFPRDKYSIKGTGGASLEAELT